MTTIIDVAKEAQVSKSTVSRVLSGNGYVSEESQKKVLAAIEKLSYTPNVVARNLQRGQTKTIGFIAHGEFGLLSTFLQHFISIAKTYNYSVTLYFTDGDLQKEIDALNQLKHKQLDALFILTRANTWQTIESYSRYGPLATWHRIDSAHIYSSYVDHFSGYLHSLRYLYAKGYRKIAHVLGHAKNLNTKARLRAIQTFYNETKLPEPQWHTTLFQEKSHQQYGEQVAQNWLNSAPAERPDAVAFYTDFVAAQFISTIELAGYHCPKDVAVMGFDNSEISALMHITTVDYSIQLQAENAFAYLYNQLNKKQLPQQSIQMKLIERQTVPTKKA